MSINFENIDIMSAFFDQLKNIAKKDKKVFFITADHGAWALSSFKENVPDQYLNIGISEQNMVSVAAGMALNGHNVFIFTITPFITQRAFEQIKMDICHSKLPVTFVGNGSSFTYAHHGTSHQAIEDIALMNSLPNLTILHPSDNASARHATNLAYKSKLPVYIKLDKGFYPDLYINKRNYNIGYFEHLKHKNKSKKICIIITGTIIHNFKKKLENINNKNINFSLFELYKIKPINKKFIINEIKKYDYIFTVEEQHINGGIGSIIADLIAENKINTYFKKFAIKDEYSKFHGDRNWLRKKYKLNYDYVLKEINKYIKTNNI